MNESAIILVFGDSPFEDKFLSDHLKTFVKHVIVSDSYDDTVGICKARHIDLLLVDFTTLHDVDLNAISAFSNVRTLVILADADIEGAQKVLEAGADDCLLKPFNFVMFKNRIEIWLEVIGMSHFVPSLAHELKVPLTGIAGFSQLLLADIAGSLNEQQSKFVQLIGLNATRLSKMISVYNDLYRIDGKHLHLSLTAVSIRDNVEAMAKTYQAQLLEKEQAISFSFADDLPQVYADEYRLNQIVSILIDNACKYTPTKGQINVSVDSFIENGSTFVIVHISDNGIAISDEDQPRIFQKWFRSEHEKVLEHSGLGLELYIAKKLIEAQGGKIWFDNKLDEGTTFHFTLPVFKLASV